jgi:hypothetical protein|tara:strand:+ start:472 stop:978 length:507 start_codon:yes stop_codon:yes gene_type:complete
MDYSEGKIYKLVDNTNNNIYIGSTINLLTDRLRSHRSKNNACSSKCIIKNNDYKIILIKDYPCSNKYELEEEEKKYILENDCVNITIPHRTKSEWSKTNYNNNIERQEYIKDYNKEYYKNNKEYYSNNAKNNKNRIKKVMCECGCEVRQDNLKRHIKSMKHIKTLIKH